MSNQIKRGAQAPRTITPHKGGRTVKVSSDVTPETKKAINALRELHGLSLGDLVEWAVQNYCHEI